ncbi:hypothetical protein [Polluticaenibacter yanchengensis]|uniref:Uncharacterized protein n=1 Tax=Polluticaenibacter yanchengensis TaxID=3014562 RepID=A0ABT4UN73_9BACT|nr:hypothetical protein [Chitinophagaceae bacterium LY-5]
MLNGCGGQQAGARRPVPMNQSGLKNLIDSLVRYPAVRRTNVQIGLPVPTAPNKKRCAVTRISSLTYHIFTFIDE